VDVGISKKTKNHVEAAIQVTFAIAEIEKPPDELLGKPAV
jgi:hypothetical protein